MNTKKNVQSVIFNMSICFIAVSGILALCSCSSTSSSKPVTGPGTPDEIQAQHYNMLKSAIEAQSKDDALVALALLQSDVSRWHTDILTVVNAMVDLAAITGAVESEDWTLVNKKFQELTVEYRHN